jgi:hypothetical protein
MVRAETPAVDATGSIREIGGIRCVRKSYPVL